MDTEAGLFNRTGAFEKNDDLYEEMERFILYLQMCIKLRQYFQLR